MTVMDFNKRLERAIVRGEQTRDEQLRRRNEELMSEADLRSLHSRCRVELSERIEQCLQKLADHFPGFRFETLVNEDGWGAKVSRDDLELRAGGRKENRYSRLELLIRPFSPARIVELAAKGTIHNKEVLNRTHYQFLSQADVDSFAELIDLWVLEYAERYAARQ
ncbi:MAG TPA: hypothetical protein VML55_24860 [Planctomycetaceae bacterium]|nr:hypothetical protein [Planctomycetaceae bacterium]